MDPNCGKVIREFSPASRTAHHLFFHFIDLTDLPLFHHASQSRTPAEGDGGLMANCSNVFKGSKGRRGRTRVRVVPSINPCGAWYVWKNVCDVMYVKNSLKIKPDGTKAWVLNGEFLIYRSDGPTIISPDSRREWICMQCSGTVSRGPNQLQMLLSDYWCDCDDAGINIR